MSKLYYFKPGDPEGTHDFVAFKGQFQVNVFESYDEYWSNEDDTDGPEDDHLLVLEYE